MFCQVANFVKCDVLEQNINEEYEQKMAIIKENDPFKDAHIVEIENEKKTNTDALNCLKTKEKISRKIKIKDADLQIDEAVKNKKIKTMIEFDKNECNSIKSIVIKGNTTLDVSSRFLKGKMLMFAKLSLKSFVYDMINVFCFPVATIQEIYSRYQIQKCFLYQNLTDTNSTSLFFNFICNVDCSVAESKAREIIFECMKKSKTAKRLDVSDEFWMQIEMYEKSTKKVMGLYEIENIDNQNICTIAINPKEYFEKFKNRKINKKHKGVRRDTEGMSFEAYANRITSLRQLDCKNDKKKITQKRFQVKNTNMMMTTINKVQFASLNDKRYYFSDEIVSLPFGHPSLSELRDYKKSLPKIHTVIKEEKDKLLQLENKIVNNNERLRI